MLKLVPTHNQTILVVDDEPAINNLIAQILRRNHFDVLQAANGQEALAQLSKAPGLVSLIILDVAMPVMDGFEFRALQQETPEISGIPVLVVTSRLSFDKDIRFLKASAYLKKPIESQLLLDTVKMHIGALAPPSVIRRAA